MATNTLIEVESGAGGLDAQDFGYMLLMMYRGWATRHAGDIDLTWNGRVGLLRLELPEDIASRLAGERGVHRLIRVSPHDREHRRQTAFARVFVNGDGSGGDLQQVRTYTLDPYQLVKNERDGFTRDDPEAVFAGDLDSLLRP